MLPRFFIRSTIFNLCFFVLTGVSCIILLPTLFFPRKIFLSVVHGFVHTTSFLEKYILGLTYEVRGAQNLPQSGSYLVAAKHQSAYETLKLHILFNDPAIVLKQNLLKIPLWGKYLAKSDVIAIDRSTPKNAIKSIQDGARRMAQRGRPIVIFPQGTRVTPNTTTKERPYKIGIVRMQEAAKIPIIPMALNTGIFHPKHKWIKKSGRVVFEFLPPIMPSDDRSATLKSIEMALEEKSAQLTEEGLNSIPAKSKLKKYITTLIILLISIYSLNWLFAAELTKNAINDFFDDIKSSPAVDSAELISPVASGFPGKITLTFPAQYIQSKNEIIEINSITVQSWPFMGMPIDIKTSSIATGAKHWDKPLRFDSLIAQITYSDNILVIKHASLIKGAVEARTSGTIDFSGDTYPVIDLTLDIQNFAPLLTELVKKNIIKKKPAMFARAALLSMEKDGVIKTTLSSKKNKIYLGPIRIIELPKKKKNTATLKNGDASNFSTRRVKVKIDPDL